MSGNFDFVLILDTHCVTLYLPHYRQSYPKKRLRLKHLRCVVMMHFLRGIILNFKDIFFIFNIFIHLCVFFIFWVFSVSKFSNSQKDVPRGRKSLIQRIFRVFNFFWQFLMLSRTRRFRAPKRSFFIKYNISEQKSTSLCYVCFNGTMKYVIHIIC